MKSLGFQCEPETCSTSMGYQLCSTFDKSLISLEKKLAVDNLWITSGGAHKVYYVKFGVPEFIQQFQQVRF